MEVLLRTIIVMVIIIIIIIAILIIITIPGYDPLSRKLPTPGTTLVP